MIQRRFSFFVPLDLNLCIHRSSSNQKEVAGPSGRLHDSSTLGSMEKVIGEFERCKLFPWTPLDSAIFPDPITGQALKQQVVKHAKQLESSTERLKAEQAEREREMKTPEISTNALRSASELQPTRSRSDAPGVAVRGGSAGEGLRLSGGHSGTGAPPGGSGGANAVCALCSWGRMEISKVERERERVPDF